MRLGGLITPRNGWRVGGAFGAALSILLWTAVGVRAAMGAPDLIEWAAIMTSLVAWPLSELFDPLTPLLTPWNGDLVLAVLGPVLNWLLIGWVLGLLGAVVRTTARAGSRKQ